MRCIIYKNPDNSVCIIAPAAGCELSIEQIAQKDVPAGTAHSIVDVADLSVVRGWDGKLYKAGEEPGEPEPIPADDPPILITSDNITMLDADVLCQAMGAGEKTAEWLIAKLEL